jgi:hypothetical protein
MILDRLFLLCLKQGAVNLSLLWQYCMKDYERKRINQSIIIIIMNDDAWYHNIII